MKKIFLLIPFLAILSACQPPRTRDQELAIYRSRCLDYGFRMGTTEFAQCMQGQEAQAEKLSIQERKLQALERQNWIEQERIRYKQRTQQLDKDRYKK